MKSIEELLRNLARPDVLEFGLVTNRLPSINVGGRFEPVDDEAPSTDRVRQMLIAMGGGRFIETLSDRPVQWTTRLEGVGVIAVAAIMRKDIVQARFTVARREGAVRPAPVPQPPPAAVPAMRPATGAHAHPPPQAFAQTQQGTGSPQPPPAPVVQRQAPPQTEEWDGDDDNEPTVQTLSPQTPQNAQPSGPPPAAGMPPPDEPRPKPPRRPEEVRQGSTTAPTAAPPGSLPPAREPSGNPPPPTEATVSSSGSSGQLEEVDVEITTNDGAALDAAHTDDAEGMEHTVEVVPKAPKADETPESRPQALPSPKPDTKPDTKSDPQLTAKTDPSLGVKLEIPSATPEKARAPVDGAAALDSFLALAAAAQATDLHLAGGRPVVLRIACELVPRTQALSPEHVERIAKEIVPPRLREALDGEGSCDFTIDHEQHGRFRVNLTRHRGGTTIAVRVLGREFPSVRGLGLPDVISASARHSQGLVLVTGPAGQGKTTTLAALVDAINASSDVPRHVYTIEDPIEHVHPKRRGMVTQREIGTHVKSWAQAIDDALSSDVDVVVIGDLRDEGAVRAAMAACEAGRLVLATMSCASAARAIDRIIERFPAAEQPRTRSTLASAIRLVTGQRLVPSADRTRLHVALEALPGTSALYTLVRDGRTHQIPALQQRARSLGFLRLDDSLSELVRTQKVTLDDAKQFAESPADLAAKKG